MTLICPMPDDLSRYQLKMSKILSALACVFVLGGLLTLLYVMLFMKNYDSSKSKRKLVLEIAGITMIIFGTGIFILHVHEKIVALEKHKKVTDTKIPESSANESLPDYEDSSS